MSEGISLAVDDQEEATHALRHLMHPGTSFQFGLAQAEALRLSTSSQDIKASAGCGVATLRLQDLAIQPLG